MGEGQGSCLIKSGAKVCLIARAGTVEALRQGGLLRTGIFGRFLAEPSSFAAYQSLGEIRNQTYDFILVCTKSFDSAEAAEDLSGYPEIFKAERSPVEFKEFPGPSPRNLNEIPEGVVPSSGDDTKIVLCQNGWGNAEKFAAFFPKERVYSARVITGFTRHKSNEVEITVHADAIHIGSLFGCDIACMKPLAVAIAEGGIPCVTVPDIEKDLWAKMLYNCALNPLGAILDVPYGGLAENSYSRDLMNRIVEEVFAVMTAAGFKTHWRSADEFLKVFYDKLVPDTARHKSSTLQDIAAGKKTEIDALTGEVLSLAEKFKEQAPCNHAIYAIIKFIEKPSRFVKTD